jgi:hypothetical protein
MGGGLGQTLGQMIEKGPSCREFLPGLTGFDPRFPLHFVRRVPPRTPLSARVSGVCRARETPNWRPEAVGSLTSSLTGSLVVAATGSAQHRPEKRPRTGRARPAGGCSGVSELPWRRISQCPSPSGGPRPRSDRSLDAAAVPALRIPDSPRSSRRSQGLDRPRV